MAKQTILHPCIHFKTIFGWNFLVAQGLGHGPFVASTQT